MRRLFLTLLLALPLAAAAQVKLGFLSYSEVMKQMPEYVQAQQKLESLKTQYDQEAKRGEEEFQRKFAEFLQGQKNFPQNILLKRQAELQNLMDAGIKFRNEADKILANAERDLMAEVEGKLNVAIEAVGIEQGYAAILNTDGRQCPFVNPALGNDVASLVLQKLGVAPASEPENEM